MKFSAIKQSGFSLVELLIVIGTITILSSIAVPALRAYQPNLKLQAESRQLTADLRLAQQMTVTEQLIYYVEIDNISGRYYLKKQTAPASPIKTISLNPAINFQEVTGFTNNSIIFNSYGAVSEAGRIILANLQGKTVTIEVKPSGYVQLH